MVLFTLQQIANIFKVYIAKNEIGNINLFTEKPKQIKNDYDEIIWVSDNDRGQIFTIETLDGNSHDYRELIEPKNNIDNNYLELIKAQKEYIELLGKSLDNKITCKEDTKKCELLRNKIKNIENMI